MVSDDSAAVMALFAAQWHLTHVQLVNWGTFCGYQHLRLTDDTGEAARVVMVTGESGTGKSTLFDAKTAVMMRSNARFNSASNQTSGRARSSRERNLYSYVMGKQDDEYDPTTGETRESYLRSTANANWSAIALTYQSTEGELFCCMRLYYVSAHASGSPETCYLTAEEELDPRAMEAHAHKRFGRATLHKAYPTARLYDGPEAFLRTTYMHLGIGRDGSGDSAMKLHERIQAGTSITDVDALFKDLVIEEPSTYALAEEACTSFREHESTWEQMDHARRKMKELSDIRNLHDDYLRLSSEADLLKSCMPGQDGPLALWMARHRREVLGAYATDCDKHLRTLAAQIDEEERSLAAQKDELERLREEVRGRGGAALDRVEHELSSTRDRLTSTCETRSRLAGYLRDIGRELPASAAAFDQLAEAAESFLGTYDEEHAKLEEACLVDRVSERELRQTEQELAKQLDFYREHPVNITPRMVEDRRRISAVTGIPETNLPYAAELMDLAEGQDAWRVAANVGFRGIATLMLVDERRLDDFSVRINSLKLDHRVNFQGVQLRPWRAPRTHADRLSSKLVFRENSPYSAWVAERVSDPAQDYLCVERPHDLGGRGQRITREGQTRLRKRGAHGYDRNTLIIGFTNEARVRELTGDLETTRHELRELGSRISSVTKQLSALGRRRDAALHLQSLRWEAIDNSSLEERIARLEEEARRLREDKDLALLVELRDTLNSQVDAHQREVGVLAQNYENLKILSQETHQAATDAQTLANQLEHTGISVSQELSALIGEHAKRLEEPLFKGREDLGLLAQRLDSIADSLIRSVRSRTRLASEQAKERCETLEKTFASYHDAWLDPDDPTGTSINSYPDYLRMLEELEDEQLDLHIDDWLVDTLRRTGAALSPLARAYTTDRREIDRRMGPINQIMGSFSFGPDHGQLRIEVDQRTPKAVREFRSELYEWASLATQSDFDDAEQLHRRLRAFMTRIEEACRQRSRGPLNTKSLVYITVVAHYPGRPELPNKAYATLGAKSGGETQELIAFILGAALLFCLGDNGQSKPTFAPVFLDEAFIKADERFTRRAIQALSGLGFQVIIAVPTSKVQAVEPVADEYVCITKSPQTSHSFIEHLSLVRRDA